MMTDGDLTCGGNHFVVYTDITLQCVQIYLKLALKCPRQSALIL